MLKTNTNTKKLDTILHGIFFYIWYLISHYGIISEDLWLIFSVNYLILFRALTGILLCMGLIGTAVDEMKTLQNKTDDGDEVKHKDEVKKKPGKE